MKVYSFKRNLKLPISLEDAWAFFSNPENLSKITPPEMSFEIISISGKESIYAGQIIKYQVSILPFLKVNWVSEITTVNKPYLFIDEQRAGPYSFWHHQHHFHRLNDGVEMIDEVNYSVPLGILGQLANRLFVARELERIFEYRSDVLVKTFNAQQT
ncbi:MAG: SRPBCC family protein [Flammeovirgaceae bacterium]|nr:SRPBCC family protein [Flammeovirgaceae bacterium]